MKKYYLAYGSNLNKEQMRWRCPDARPVGTAEIDGYELLFKGSRTGSYLTIEQREGSTVPVAIWEVSQVDEKRLDRYEGFPHFYYKKSMDVACTNAENGAPETVKAFIYIMHESNPYGIPTSQYMDTCATGYLDFGFDLTVLTNALLESEKGMCYER